MEHNKDILQTKVGVLGGGQLGKMLALAAGNWHLPIYFLDESRDFPAGPFATGFTEGSFKNYDDVYNFGKQVDILTIEIEHVNTDALLQLEKEGIDVTESLKSFIRARREVLLQNWNMALPDYIFSWQD